MCVHPLILCSAAQDSHLLKITPVQCAVCSTRVSTEQHKVLNLPLLSPVLHRSSAPHGCSYCVRGSKSPVPGDDPARDVSFLPLL